MYETDNRMHEADARPARRSSYEHHDLCFSELYVRDDSQKYNRNMRLYDRAGASQCLARLGEALPREAGGGNRGRRPDPGQDLRSTDPQEWWENFVNHALCVIDAAIAEIILDLTNCWSASSETCGRIGRSVGVMGGPTERRLNVNNYLFKVYFRI